MKIKNIYTALCLILISFSLSAQLRAYKPELVSPADSSDNQMPVNILDWHPVSGFYNIRYDIQICENADFQSDVLTFETVETAMETPALLFNTKYYWRVRAKDDNNTSEWSDVWSYNTLINFVCTAPGVAPQAPRPTLKWNSSDKTFIMGVSKFEVVMAGTEEFDVNDELYRQFFVYNKEEENFDGVKFPNAVVDSLIFGKTYFWKVRAYNYGEGNLSGISEWSEVASFEVVSRNELNKPKMSGNNNIDVSPTETLGLKNSFSPAKYIYQVDINEDFSNPMEYESKTINLRLDTLKFGQKYYWRAAMKYGNSISEWTEETWWFTIINAPVLSDPENGTEITPKDNIKFRSISGVEEYIIEVSSDPNFSPDLTNTLHLPQAGSGAYINVAVNKFILTEYDITYYWRVKAGNQKHGETEWSEVKNFILKKAVGIEDSNVNSSLYPNPNNGSFYLKTEKNIDNAIINIFDLTGRNVYTENTSLSNEVAKEINASLPKGVYILQVNSNKVKINKKFTVM